MIRLHPIRYDPKDIRTNLVHIAQTQNYEDSLIIFNDNFFDRNRNIQGANTAMLRPLAFENPCRVVGVSTGWSAEDGGFKSLGDIEKEIITTAFERINTILHSNAKLHRVIYSCDLKDSKKLGFATFKPANEVVDFINERLMQIPERFNKGLPVSFLALNMLEEIIESKRESRLPNLNKYDYSDFPRSIKN